MRSNKHLYLEVSEPKRVNPILNIIRANSLRLEGLRLKPDYIWNLFTYIPKNVVKLFFPGGLNNIQLTNTIHN